MKKEVKILIISLAAVIIVALAGIILYRNNKKELTVPNEIEVNKDITLKSLLGNDIEILNDAKIDTEKLGEQEIEVKYKNKIFTYKEKIKIVITDTEAPELKVKDLKITKGTQIDISKEFVCIDNYDENPNCYVEGNYNVNEEGIYALKYVGEDSSNNKSEKQFTLTVYEPKQETSSKMVCRQSKSMMGIDINAVVDVTLEDNYFREFNMTITTDLPEEYMSQKQSFAETFRKGYENFEEEYGVKPNVFETERGIQVTAAMTAEQAQKYLATDTLMTTKEDLIRIFAEQGYTCE